MLLYLSDSQVYIMEHGVGYFADRRINACVDDVTNAAWIQSIVA